MSRHRRVSPDNSIHHVLNRGNRRATIFHKPADYVAFVNLLCDTLDRVPMRILAACVMPNHFHLVLWPRAGSDLSAYMRWLMNTHVRRYHEHYGTTGHGHVYQGRFKNFVVQSDAHLYNVLRYVEANPVRANLVSDARLWRWSSAGFRFTPDGRSYLTDWPLPRPANWGDYVNGTMAPDELRRIQLSVRKGTPYGEASWVRHMVRLHGLQSTVRTRGAERSIQPGYALGFE